LSSGLFSATASATWPSCIAYKLRESRVRVRTGSCTDGLLDASGSSTGSSQLGVFVGDHELVRNRTLRSPGMVLAPRFRRQDLGAGTVTGDDGGLTGAVEVARPAGGRERLRERARARLDDGVVGSSTGARERPRGGAGAPVIFASCFSRREFVRDGSGRLTTVHWSELCVTVFSKDLQEHLVFFFLHWLQVFPSDPSHANGSPPEGGCSHLKHRSCAGVSERTSVLVMVIVLCV
jgi:hypothetical protein